jgi:tetratricopeptide (TPR) repeat protein
MAYRTARAGDFVAHRRWALRLFIVASAVWFFRIALMLWLAVNGGPAGFDAATFTGPLLTFLAFAQTLVPLALLELYLFARDRASAGTRFAISGGLVVVTLAMAGGIAAAATAIWLPRMDVRTDRLSDEIETTMSTKGVDAGIAQFRQIRAQGFAGWYEKESDTNALGYQLLRSGHPDRAIAVFELNVEAHPMSANAHDSLAEAYLATGQRPRAIETYEKALALDPTLESANAALRHLGVR